MPEYIEREAVAAFLKDEIQQCERLLLESNGEDDRYEQAVESRMLGLFDAWRKVTDAPTADVVDRAYVVFLIDFFGDMRTWSIENILSEIKRKPIEDAPVADVEAVRHGEWVRAENDGEWKCSLCGGEIVVDAYGDIHPLDDCGWIGCPYCLAKMNGKGEGE